MSESVPPEPRAVHVLTDHCGSVVGVYATVDLAMERAAVSEVGGNLGVWVRFGLPGIGCEYHANLLLDGPRGSWDILTTALVESSPASDSRDGER